MDLLWGGLADALRVFVDLQIELLKGLPTLVLAGASVVVAYMSWRTAQRANRLTQGHWEADHIDGDHTSGSLLRPQTVHR